MIRSEGLGFKSSPRYLNGQLRLSVFLFLLASAVYCVAIVV